MMSYKWWRNLPSSILKKIPIQNEFILTPISREYMVKIVDITSETGKLLAIGIDVSRGFYVKEISNEKYIAKVDYNNIDFDDPLLSKFYNKELYEEIVEKTVEEALRNKTYIMMYNIYIPISEDLERLFKELLKNRR